MAFNHTLSAILRGKWLIDKQWADGQMPMVLSFMKGETVDFGFKQSVQQINPVLIAHAGAGKPVFGVRPGNDVRGLPSGSIAQVDLVGPMVKQDAMCGPSGMVSKAQLISDLSNSENVDGIVLNIDSPGGQADGTALLSDAIKNASKNKPVIAIINDGMAASAAMWIASAANEIYVTQTTDQVGSIGVYTQIADWASFYREAMKLNIQDIYAPQSTDKNKDYKDAIAGDTSAIEDDLSVLAEQFINTISTNRAGKIKGDKWKTGKMFYAGDATKIGLIDGVKSFDQVLQRMNKLINYPTSSQNKKPNMAFTKTISSAKAEAFAVVDGGFLLEENQLINIENALIAGEIASAELETAQASVVSLGAEIVALKEKETTAQASISAKDAKITELEAKVVELGKAPSGTGTIVKTKGDENPDRAPVASYESDSNPANAWADKMLSRRKPAAEKV